MNRKLTAIAAMLLVSSGATLAADLKVAAMLANVPFEFQDANGKLVGYEVDLVNQIGKRLNKSVEFTQIPFNSLFSAVQSGRANIAIGSISITPKRLQSVSFSQPIMDSEACVTTAAGSSIKNLGGLGGKQVAVITGTTGEAWATANQAKYKFGGISRYDDGNQPMMDIAAGRIDGFVQDCPIVKYYIKDKPQYSIVTSIPTNEREGLMFAKDSKLLQEVNEVVTKMKQDGELGRLYVKWFGTPAGKGSSPITVMPIPK